MFGQWQPTYWHACYQSNLQQTATNRWCRQVSHLLPCSSVEPTVWMKLYGPFWPCGLGDGHPVLWSCSVVQFPLSAAYDLHLSTASTHASLL